MDDSFDWVTARLRAVPKNAFKELRDHCKGMVDIHNKSQKAINAPYTLELKQGNDAREFSVLPSPPRGGYGSSFQVNFSQSVTGIHIRILDSAHASLNATPYLTKKGNLRFKINRYGSYKLWQVARLALEPLFFAR